MKFSCSREVLDKQLQHISRIIAIRNSMLVLSNVLLETDGKILRISGTDLDLAVTTYLPAKVEMEGTFTVPAKILQEFVHQNPDELLSFNLEGYELVCTSTKVEARIGGIDPEEYPTLPKVEKAKKISLPLVEFCEAMKQVVIACAADQTRPVLTGVYAQFNNDEAVFAATDSFRLVERKLKIVPVQETLTILIPGRTIQEIIRIAAGMPEVQDLELEVSEQQLLARLGDVELYSRLITGNFPKYQAIIPSKVEAQAEVTSAEFIQALRLSGIFSQAGISNVMLEIDKEGTFLVASYGSQKGATKNTMYAVLEKKFTPLRVAFNVKFLLDAAQAANATHLQLKFSGTTSPLVILTEDPNYLQLVMPIRLDQ